MKRFFFSLIALSAAAIGCTQSAMLEAPDLFSTEVSFSPYTGRTPETKATSIEGKAGLAADGFYVYGFLNQTGKDKQVYLENELVSSADNGSTWSYGNLIYWPTSEGSSLDFVAYSANGVGKGLSGVSENGFTFTVSETVTNQVDLLATAYQAGNTLAGGSSVSLKFHHLLSRVGFKVQSTTSKEVTITDLTFTGDMPTQGTLDFDAATVKSATDKAIPELQPTVIGTPEYDCLTGDAAPATSGRVPGTEYLMIMPHIVGAEYDNINTDELKGSDHHIDVTYVIEGSEDKPRTSRVTLPIGFEFAAGKAYEIVLKISTSSLTFDVQEEDWNSKNNDANINPNEPPVPEPEPEVQDPITYEETSVTGKGVILSLERLNYDSAIITLKVIADTTYKDRGEVPAVTITIPSWIPFVGGNQLTFGGIDHVDDKEIGITFRERNKSWSLTNNNTSLLKGSAIRGDEFTFSLSLDSSKEYDCSLYAGIRSYSFQYEDQYGSKAPKDPPLYDSWQYAYGTDEGDVYLSFITPSNIEFPSLSIEDIKSNDITNITGTNQFKVTVRAGYQLGHIDNTKIEITECGLCWRMGTEAPTILDEKQTVELNPTNTSYNLSNTIPNLKANTTYSVCAYAIFKEDRGAYVLSSPNTTEYQSISTKDQIIYSKVHTFRTEPIINSNNNSDAEWDNLK